MLPRDEPERLAEALDAYLARGEASGESDTFFLDRHPHLRDLLAPMLTKDDQAAAPRQVGPYEIRGELGRGGMGVVYAAEHSALRREVALKLLPSGLAAWPRRVERFLREAVAVAKLDHPGIVRVYDAGEADGVFYYAMERVRGGSLRAALDAVRQRCQGEPRRLIDAPQFGTVGCRGRIDEVAAIGVQVAEALAHAHTHGIVHRDIKPQNLLLDADARPRLVDFGLVKDLDDFAPVSVEFAGTPQYASPEQVDPARFPLDGRCDVFALGVVLYELACLRRPFDGDSTQAALRAVLHDEPRSLRSLDPRIPLDFEAVVLKALEKDPRARYASAAAFAEDLRRFRAGRPVLARRRSTARSIWRWVANHRAITVAMTLAAVLLIGAPSAALWFTARSRAQITAERDAARESLRVARHAVDRLADSLNMEDAAESTVLRRFRLDTLRLASQGYSELLKVAGPERDLLLQASRTAQARGTALASLGRQREAIFEQGRAIELALRAPHCAERTIVAAKALTARAAASLNIAALDAARQDFARARQLWCESEDLAINTTAQGRAVLAGRAQTELTIARAYMHREPLTSRAALASAELAAQAANLEGEETTLHVMIAQIERDTTEGERDSAARRLTQAGSLLDGLRKRLPRTVRIHIAAARVAELRALLTTNESEALAACDEALAIRTRLVREFPDEVLHRFNLSAAHSTYSRIALRLGDASRARRHAQLAIDTALALAEMEDSTSGLVRVAAGYTSLAACLGKDEIDLKIGLLDESCRLLEVCAQREPNNTGVSSDLGGALSNRAQICLDTERAPQAASALLERAIEFQRKSLAAAPRSVDYRSYLVKQLTLATEAQRQLKNGAGMRKHLDELRQLADGNADDLVTTARGLVICARTGQADALDAALDCLHRVKELGQVDRLDAVARDPRFGALHQDERFKTLLRP